VNIGFSMDKESPPRSPRNEARGPPDAKLPSRIAQQIRINEKYRYIAELRFEIDQVKNEINSIRKISYKECLVIVYCIHTDLIGIYYLWSLDNFSRNSTIPLILPFSLTIVCNKSSKSMQFCS
jgi:hypothetical protein